MTSSCVEPQLMSRVTHSCDVGGLPVSVMFLAAVTLPPVLFVYDVAILSGSIGAFPNVRVHGDCFTMLVVDVLVVFCWFILAVYNLGCLFRRLGHLTNYKVGIWSNWSQSQYHHWLGTFKHPHECRMTPIFDKYLLGIARLFFKWIPPTQGKTGCSNPLYHSTAGSQTQPTSVPLMAAHVARWVNNLHICLGCTLCIASAIFLAPLWPTLMLFMEWFGSNLRWCRRCMMLKAKERGFSTCWCGVDRCEAAHHYVEDHDNATSSLRLSSSSCDLPCSSSLERESNNKAWHEVQHTANTLDCPIDEEGYKWANPKYLSTPTADIFQKKGSKHQHQTSSAVIPPRQMLQKESLHASALWSIVRRHPMYFGLALMCLFHTAPRVLVAIFSPAVTLSFPVVTTADNAEAMDFTTALLEHLEQHQRFNAVNTALVVFVGSVGAVAVFLTRQNIATMAGIGGGLRWRAVAFFFFLCVLEMGFKSSVLFSYRGRVTEAEFLHYKDALAPVDIFKQTTGEDNNKTVNSGDSLPPESQPHVKPLLNAFWPLGDFSHVHTIGAPQHFNRKGNAEHGEEYFFVSHSSAQLFAQKQEPYHPGWLMYGLFWCLAAIPILVECLYTAPFWIHSIKKNQEWGWRRFAPLIVVPVGRLFLIISVFQYLFLCTPVTLSLLFAAREILCSGDRRQSVEVLVPWGPTRGTNRGEMYGRWIDFICAPLVVNSNRRRSAKSAAVSHILEFKKRYRYVLQVYFKMKFDDEGIYSLVQNTIDTSSGTATVVHDKRHLVARTLLQIYAAKMVLFDSEQSQRHHEDEALLAVETAHEAPTAFGSDLCGGDPMEDRSIHELNWNAYTISGLCSSAESAMRRRLAAKWKTDLGKGTTDQVRCGGVWSAEGGPFSLGWSLIVESSMREELLSFVFGKPFGESSSKRTAHITFYNFCMVPVIFGVAGTTMAAVTTLAFTLLYVPFGIIVGTFPPEASSLSLTFPFHLCPFLIQLATWTSLLILIYQWSVLWLPVRVGLGLWFDLVAMTPFQHLPVLCSNDNARQQWNDAQMRAPSIPSTTDIDKVLQHYFVPSPFHVLVDSGGQKEECLHDDGGSKSQNQEDVIEHQFPSAAVEQEQEGGLFMHLPSYTPLATAAAVPSRLLPGDVSTVVAKFLQRGDIVV